MREAESDMTEQLNKNQRHKEKTDVLPHDHQNTTHTKIYMHTYTDTHTQTIHVCMHTHTHTHAHTEFIICLVGNLSATQFLTFLLPAFI